MASDIPHQQEFRIRDLTTRSVLLFPSRAQIIRDIQNVTLKPGPNQIVIDGLSPLADEHSIKVEGTGSATITDVTVDLLPNREVYEDIYPSEEEEDDDKGDVSGQSDVEAEEILAIDEKVKSLKRQLLEAQENINSAAERLRICDHFGQSVKQNRPPPGELKELIEAYDKERLKIYRDHANSLGILETINNELRKLEKEKLSVAKALAKASEKSRKEKAKEKEKKERKKAEIAKEKLRLQAERDFFWPKWVYRITINLEPSSVTPASSRRSSINGDTIVNLATSDFHEPSSETLKSDEISLSISYITYGASWAPRYDLSLNTVKCTGLLEYGAELKNTTSETWHNVKIILSTSQTSFFGLSENIPSLSPWHARLEKGDRHADWSLFSSHELQAKQSKYSQSTGYQAQRPRHALFGRGCSEHERINRPRTYSALMYRSNSASPVYSSTVAGHSTKKARTHLSQNYGGESDEDVDMSFGVVNYPTATAPSLTFEEGAWEETGMTTTYDVPGFKTLAPSNSAIKHKIAKIEFKNIVYSHIVIGKLRQVAFLKARLRNTSKTTLLKGPLGLTLDGSFLGQATFPRCSSGEMFSLPLGVDPAISICYPKPTVRRSQTGIFTKEDCNVFSRACIITNTKPNAAVKLTVLDQIPVSEDERLKIEISTPKGLKVAGDAVRTGVGYPAEDASPAQVSVRSGTATDARASVYAASGREVSSGAKWGSAIATAKKGGEINWNVNLNPGHGVKLVLEYEATFPGGEAVVSVSK